MPAKSFPLPFFIFYSIGDRNLGFPLYFAVPGLITLTNFLILLVLVTPPRPLNFTKTIKVA